MHNPLFRLTLVACLAAPLCLYAGERYAFLVGVQKYHGTGLRELDYSEKDVRDLARLLVTVGYKPANIVVQTEPDAAAIRRQLEQFDLAADDTLLAAFSGHGVQLENKSYFCPAATNLADPKTLLSLEDLYKTLADRKAGTTVILVDACRSNPQENKSATVRVQSITRPATLGGIELFFSCSPKQESFEHPPLEHGVFFHFVIKGLRGEADYGSPYQLRDGLVTSSELHTYLADNVEKYVKENLRREQTPHYLSDRHRPPVLAKVGLPTQAPKRAAAPFDSDDGLRQQQAWAEYLGTPVYWKNELGMEFALIPPHKLKLGSEVPAVELGKRFNRNPALLEDEYPQHDVDITEPIYVSRTEVTVAQFAQFVKEKQEKERSYQTDAERNGTGGYGWIDKLQELRFSKKFNWRVKGYSQELSHPVVLVSYNDAVAFCEWLSERTSATYRLLTEREWEAACRAGTTSLWSNGDAETTLARVANLADKSSELPYAKNWQDGSRRTAPVGSFDPNPFGLYDMHGNVGEWCSDVFARYNKPAAEGELRRIIRGGSWESLPEMARSTLREAREPRYCCDATGFRVALVPQPRTNGPRAAAP